MMKANRVIGIGRFVRSGLMCLLAVVAVENAKADSLPLSLAASPNIVVADIASTYTGNAFTAIGTAWLLEDGAANTGIICDTSLCNGLGSFDLSATINNSGVATSGSLTIGGYFSPTDPGPTLLTGNLTGFGSDPGVFDFTFSPTGGDLAALFGGSGSTIGVILNDPYLPGSFPTSFTGDPSYDPIPGTADVAPLVAQVPEPSSMLLILTGGVGLLLRLRKGSKRATA